MAAKILREEEKGGGFLPTNFRLICTNWAGGAERIIGLLNSGIGGLVGWWNNGWRRRTENGLEPKVETNETTSAERRAKFFGGTGASLER
jgi:hypothetical protein